MDRLLSKDPRSRLSLEVALTHPWLKRRTPAGMHGLQGDSFVSHDSYDTAGLDGDGTTHVGTEVPQTRDMSPQSSPAHDECRANGSSAQFESGSMAALSASASDEYSQPFSQLALDHAAHAPQPALAARLDSRFPSDGGSGFVGGSWAPANGGGAMDLDAGHSNGEGFNVPVTNDNGGPPPQPYSLNAPPVPLYHPPITKARAPPASIPPTQAPQVPSQPEPTPKRKRSSSPVPAGTPESINGNGATERTLRDQTLLGSPAAISASSSLSDPPASPKEMDQSSIPPPPAPDTMATATATTASVGKIKGQSFSSPVKRSARIKNQKATPASTKKPPAQRTPGGNSGRNVRRKTDSPVESSILATGARDESPAPANGTRTRTAANGARRKSGRLA